MDKVFQLLRVRFHGSQAIVHVTNLFTQLIQRRLDLKISVLVFLGLLWLFIYATH